MKVYFHGTPRAFQQYAAEHLAIYRAIEHLGHSHLLDIALLDPDEVYNSDHEAIVGMYEETMRRLRQSDLLVVEISTHSMSLGFLINKALEQNKPVIALYLKDRPPFFLTGISNDKLQFIEYSLDNIEESLSDAIDYAKDSTDVRFNFFISPSQVAYLDWITQKKHLPRSVYLRRLISEDMIRDEAYSQEHKTKEK